MPGNGTISFRYLYLCPSARIPIMAVWAESVDAWAAVLADSPAHAAFIWRLLEAPPRFTRREGLHWTHPAPSRIHPSRRAVH